jgi:putative restriction endonuclease
MTLFSFAETKYEPSNADAVDEAEFHLTGRGKHRRIRALTRPGQGTFRFAVFVRYGPRCALCDIQHAGLLHAAHLCPIEAGGSDDPRNGLVWCMNHHRAFSLGLVRIDPETLDVLAAPSLPRSDWALKSLKSLPRLPSRDALRWAWEHGGRVERASALSRRG